MYVKTTKCFFLRFNEINKPDKTDAERQPEDWDNSEYNGESNNS